MPIKFVVTGNSMFTRRFSVQEGEEADEIRQLIGSADVAFTNFEGPAGIPGAYPSKQYSFASYFYGPDWLAEELKLCGFNIVSVANNHFSDYSSLAVERNLEMLRDAGLVYAGAGIDLDEARRPGYLDTSKGRVAIIGVDSSYEIGELTRVQMASRPRDGIPGRPGVNGLRWHTYYDVRPDDLKTLGRIAKDLGIGSDALLAVAPPEHAAAPEGVDVVLLGSWFCESDTPGIRTACHAGDLDDVLKWVRDATRQADYVFVTQHIHHSSGDQHQWPPGFVEEFARACIDEGASAFVGQGDTTHAIEIYKGHPIFYNLGNFSFEVETLQRYPGDSYERVGLSADATPADYADSRRITERAASYFEGILGTFEFDGPTLTKVEFHPLELSRLETRPKRGTPRLLKGKEGAAVVDFVRDASERYGSLIYLEGSKGVVKIEKD